MDKNELKERENEKHVTLGTAKKLTIKRVKKTGVKKRFDGRRKFAENEKKVRINNNDNNNNRKIYRKERC